MQCYRINKITWKPNAEKCCYERNQIYWGIPKSSTENQTQICKIILWQKFCLKICGRIHDGSLYWKKCNRGTLSICVHIFSQWSGCSSIKSMQLSSFAPAELLLLCLRSLVGTLPRESKQSLFFPGSQKSQCRRIPVSLSLFPFLQLALFTYKQFEVRVQNLIHALLNVPDSGWWMSNFYE